MGDTKYFPPKCKFTVNGYNITTDRTVKNKVSGTAIAGILGCSPWSSPFQVACSLLGLGREDISKKPEVIVGQALESDIIKYAGEKYASYGLFMSAEEVYEKRAGDHDAWVSDFNDDVFAGHVDGIVMADDANYILEVKTSRNLDSWAEGVPEYYYWQVALYNEFIAKQDKAYVVLGITNEFTMKDYNSWIPNEKTVGMFEMEIDREEVQAKMEEVRGWYNKYIVNGITPDYDPNNPKDVELYNHLDNLAKDVTDIEAMIDQLADIDARIMAHEDEQASLYTFRDNLKKAIKEYQIGHSLSKITSSSGEFESTLYARTTTTFDEPKMVRDGIDVSKYKTVTKTETTTVKRKKTTTKKKEE